MGNCVAGITTVNASMFWSESEVLCHRRDPSNDSYIPLPSPLPDYCQELLRSSVVTQNIDPSRLEIVTSDKQILLVESSSDGFCFSLY